MELNPLKMIDPIVILGVIAIFTVTHFVLRRTFFLPVIEVMERRRDRLDAAAAMREEAAETGRRGEQEAAEVLERGRDRASRVAASIRDREQTAHRERLDGERARTAESMDRGRIAIAQEREAELAKLRTETATCVTMACDRLIGGADPHTVDSIVDRLIARRVH